MAESDTILQLGIEAAREGNREEARNLFTLLTSQDPDNVQGWLWLAGVANGPDERRSALEKVIVLDPTNEMAVRGLQAMGVNPSATAVRTERASTPEPVRTEPPPAPSMGALSDEERYAAELDSAFDDYDTVERAAPPPRYEPTPVFDTPSDQTADSGRRGSRSTTTTDSTERIRTQPRRAQPRRARDDDETSAGAGGLFGRFGGGGGGMSSRTILLGVLLLALLVLVIIGITRFSGGGGGVAQEPTPTLDSSLGGVPTLGGTTGFTNTGGLTGTTGLTGSTGLTDTAGLTGTQPLVPTPEPLVPTQPPPDVAGVNPAPVPVGTILSANGWSYSFPNACVSTCGVAIGNQIGGSTAKGTYVVVLMFIANSTGSDQPLPADFFVLKDAQGRVYTPDPQASSAYTIRGVNADLALTDAVPGNNGTTSVNLVFDVQPGATNLVLFARSKTDQGFQVLNAAP